MNSRIIVITNPMPKANKSAEVTLGKFLRVINSEDRDITLIGANITLEKDVNFVNTYSVDLPVQGNKIKKLFSMIQFQIAAVKYILKNVRKEDKVFFWLGDKMILPYLAIKNKNAELNYFIYGNLEKEVSQGLFSKLSSRLVRYMANNATNVFMESKAVLDDWNGKIRNSNCCVMHLYTDYIGFMPMEDRKNIVGMVCRVAEVKHVRECITAFHSFHKNHPEWKLEIIGTGKDEENCRNLISSLNASSYIRMLGWKTHKEMKEICKYWKFYLLASDHEGVPNGIIEMMGLGIPPVVHPVGGIPDVVENNTNGIFIAGVLPNDIEFALESMLKIQNYESMSASAYKKIKNEYSLDAAKQIAANFMRNEI